MDIKLRKKIEKKAYEIYLNRLKNHISGCALGDWLEAEAIILKDRRITDGCPKCGGKFLGRENNKMICLTNGCGWEIEAKRLEDEKYPTIQELKRIWES